MAAPPSAPAPDCMRCRSYFVTHDARRPHGCRAFAFTSQRLPRDEVRLSSGRECAAFEARRGRSSTESASRPPGRPGPAS